MPRPRIGQETFGFEARDDATALGEIAGLVDWSPIEAARWMPSRSRSAGGRETLRSADGIFVDETRAPVLDPGQARTRSGYFRALSRTISAMAAPPPVVMVAYAPGRGAACAIDVPSGYRGRFLQCDGFDVYGKVPVLDRPEGHWQLETSVSPRF